MTCAIPPVDMRFARVVAKTARGMDFMYFDPDGTPRSGPVVAPLAGWMLDGMSFAQMHLRRALLYRFEDGTYAVFSGMTTTGRPPFGAHLERGAVLGQLDQPGSFTERTLRAFRGLDVTAGADPIYPYLHMEFWAELPTIREWLTTRGRQWIADGGRRINPVEWWRAQGFELVGPSRSETLQAVVGGPSDPSGCP